MLAVGVLVGMPARALARSSHHADSVGIPVCEEVMSAEFDSVPVVATTALVALPNTDALPILPCALADNGLFGPACADASFYLVNHAGVLLCAVDVDFTLTQAPITTVDKAPPGTTSSAPPHATVALGALGTPLPRPCGRDVVAAVWPSSQLAQRARSRPPVPPS